MLNFLNCLFVYLIYYLFLCHTIIEITNNIGNEIKEVAGDLTVSDLMDLKHF